MPTRAVMLDALGTIVDLDSPFERLGRSLAGTVAAEEVERAMRVEMAYYREHAHEGRDPRSLAGLRERCARLLSAELGREVSVEAMMAAIHFRPAPGAAEALAGLRDRVQALLCVSNWDCSLEQVLAGIGLAELLDQVLTSAELGARKPDPAVFAEALRRAECDPAEALFVGDSLVEDIAGARDAGIPALLLDRSGNAGGAPAGVPVIASLAAISDHLQP